VALGERVQGEVTVPPAALAFIGKPPAEIEKLVADTRTAAKGVEDVIPDEGPPQPDELLSAMGRLSSRLSSLFDA
jgi:hypothetical protein